MNILISSKKKKDSIIINNIKYNLIFKSSLNQEKKKISFISNLRKIKDYNDIKKILKNLDDHFSIIIWSKNFLFCTVDQVCSFPLIYYLKNNKIHIADNINEIDKSTLNLINLKAIKLSGYGISNLTNFTEYYSLKPCEYFLYDKLKLERGFWFSTNYNYKTLSKNKTASFHNFINNEFSRLKKKSEDSCIIVPLSSGVDSRFIVSGLKYFNVKNFKTFTYGSFNTRDFKIADQISRQINIENKKILLNYSIAREIYKSKIFKEYLRFNDLGIASNNPGDFLAIKLLLKENWINPKDIVVNGQAGDFISGNHIPFFLLKKNLSSMPKLIDSILDYIISKHYNLWYENLISKTQISIRELIKNLYFNNITSLKKLIAAYECFEFENRQIKWVVGQQKVYDFFNLEWTLPLWNRRLIKLFFRNVTINDKINQKFYKDFLIKEDICSLWKNIEINPKERFKIQISIMRFLVKIAFIFIGKIKWYKFEKKFISYFLDPIMLPAYISYKKYISTFKIPRNALSFIVKDYVRTYLNKMK
jgi:asparagine synthase (glutamine-hydrolysing)